MYKAATQQRLTQLHVSVGLTQSLFLVPALTVSNIILENRAVTNINIFSLVRYIHSSLKVTILFNINIISPYYC